MDNNTKIMVKNTLQSPIEITLPNVRFVRLWQPGASYPIPMEILYEAIYDSGTKFYIDRGALLIEDRDARIELGLPVDIEGKVLTEAQMLKLLKVDTAIVFEKALQELNTMQAQNMADYAIIHQIVDVQKCNLIKKYTGIDVMKAITLKQQNEEVDVPVKKK